MCSATLHTFLVLSPSSDTDPSKSSHHIKRPQIEIPPFISGRLDLASLLLARKGSVHSEGTSVPKPGLKSLLDAFQVPNRWSWDSPVCSGPPLPYFWGRLVSFSARAEAVVLPGHHLCFISRGNKPANSPKGQPPDADGHSSVTDLANSLTGDMVMVRSNRC